LDIVVWPAGNTEVAPDSTDCSGISLGWGGRKEFHKIKKMHTVEKKNATIIKITTVFFFYAMPKILQIKYPKVKLNEVLKVSTTLSPSHCFSHYWQLPN